MRWRRVGAATLAIFAVACSGGADDGQPGATTDRPVPFTTVAPPSTAACEAGEAACVDDTIAEMVRRLDRLGATCDHNAVFALTYLRITEEYRRTIDDPGAFDDVAFMNRLDALFAEFYFAAFDAYERGDVGSVAPAWRIAFDQAEAGRVSALGDALLGVNAHINRDLPFVIDQLGLTGRAGRDRQGDFDAVNAVFPRVFGSIIEDAAARFDPSFADPSVLGGLTLEAGRMIALVGQWRDAAFRSALRLSSATTPEARQEVARQIDDRAAVLARSLQLTTTLRDVESSSARDAYCQSRA